MKFILVVSLFYFTIHRAYGQDRFVILEQRLNDLSQNIQGLNQKVETAVSNTSLYEFLKAIAATHKLNFNVDPTLTQKVTSYFSNENVKNLLVYLAKQYNLDYSFTGSIITIAGYKDPLSNITPPIKEVNVKLNPATQNISFDLNNDSLLAVARKITQLSNKNIVVLPELFSKKVTGYIQDLPLNSALEKIALSNSFKLNQTNDDVYVLESLKVNEEIITNQNPPSNANYSVRKVSSTPNGSSSTITISEKNGKKLVNVSVVNIPIKDVIKSVAEQAGVNYFIYSDLVGNSTASVQNMDFDMLLGYLLQSTAYTFNVEKGVYMIGSRQDEGLRSYKLIQLKYRSVDSLLAVIPIEIKRGVDIKEFKELNSFLLSGSQPQIKEIEAFVYQIDKTVPMVMIEVILMDVQKRRTVETGFKIGISDSSKPGGTILGGGTDFTFSAGDINQFIDRIGLNNVFNIGRVTPKFYASLKALESNTDIDLRQTPKLSTLNGHTANLSIGSTRYYAVTTQNVLGSLNPQTVVTQQYFPIEANMSIKILPFVSGDEQVTLNIDIDMSDFIGNTPINVPPPTASSKFSSIIRIKNEEMVVLGGIERTEKSEEGSGTPILSRIPVLKWLFSTKAKTTGKTVSVVFIKPTIIF